MSVGAYPKWVQSGDGRDSPQLPIPSAYPDRPDWITPELTHSPHYGRALQLPGERAAEGVLDADGLEQLNGELANSPDRVREFNDLRLLTGALSDLMRESGAVAPTKTLRFPYPLRWIAAAAACLVVGLALWFTQSQKAAPGKLPRQTASLTTTELAPGWVSESCGATFSVVAPGRVRLEQGELFVKSVAMEPRQGERAPLSIETDAGVATAKGTEFFVGSHDQEGEWR